VGGVPGRPPAGTARPAASRFDALAEETIYYKDIHGRIQRMNARVTEYDPTTRSPTVLLTRRIIDTDTLEEYVQKRVHRAGRNPTATSTASTSGDGRRCAGQRNPDRVALVYTFTEQAYPRELSRLFGFTATTPSGSRSS
jgi:hypothetical protein